MALAQLDIPTTPPPTEPARTARQGELTGARRVLAEASERLGRSLAEISRAIGKDSSYCHSFISKRKPRALSAPIREALGRVLGIAPALLLDEDEEPDAPPQMPQPLLEKPSLSLVPRLETLRPVPLYRMGDVMDPTAARRFVAAFPCVDSGPAAAAIWIDTPAARLSPGDIAYAKSDLPVRIGDLVVVLDADMRIVDAGELHSVTASTVVVHADQAARTYPRAPDRVLKVVGTVYP